MDVKSRPRPVSHHFVTNNNALNFCSAGGKTVTVAVEDKCTSCAMFDLDMSPAAFDKLADPSVKRIDGVTWKLL